MSEQGACDDSNQSDAAQKLRVRGELRGRHDFMQKNRLLTLQRGYRIEELVQMSGPEAAGKVREAFSIEPYLDRLMLDASDKERFQFVPTVWGDDHGATFSHLVRMAVRRCFPVESVWIGDTLASEVFPKIEPLPPKPRGWSDDPQLRELYTRNPPETFVPFDEQRSAGVTGFPVVMSADRWDTRRQDICQAFVIDQVYQPLLAGEDDGALRYIGEAQERGISVRLVDLFYGWEPWTRNARMKELSALDVNGVGDVYGQKVALAGPEVLTLLAIDPGFRFRLGAIDFPNVMLSAYRITVDGKEAIPTLIRRQNRLELGYYFFGNGAQTAHLSAPKVILPSLDRVR
ncbi:hypothetical protein KBC55_04480 [Patescibacteria group bacterium]|nr:hypothetical protein [Patescibacteria group bacterium]